MKCRQCGAEYEAKRSTSRFCSNKCRQAADRNARAEQAKAVTLKRFEKCRYCGVDLPKLQTPRKYPGACLKCVNEGRKSEDKSGLDVSCFEDLPEDVQQSIETTSKHADDYEAEKAKRTKAAIKYQRIFPDRHFNKTTTGKYMMTAYEQQHYKPANELHAHEFNPVSKPGDSHYIDEIELKEGLAQKRASPPKGAGLRK